VRASYTVGVDQNHAQIAQVYKSAYFTVIDYTRMGGGHPDVGIAFGHRIHVLREFKIPGEDLSAVQKHFAALYRGPKILVIHGPEEALADIECLLAMIKRRGDL